jgi:hypothetical protein
MKEGMEMNERKMKGWEGGREGNERRSGNE